MIFPEIRPVISIDAELERPFPLRAPHEIQLRMKRVASSCLQIEALASPGVPAWLDVQHVWLETIRSVIRVIENLIIEIQIESQQRIRDHHLGEWFLNMRRIPFVGIRHLDRRVQILAERNSARA